MSSNYKRSTALLFLSVICSSTVFAQNEDWRQIPPSERRFKASDFEAREINGESDSEETFKRHNFEDEFSKNRFRFNIDAEARDESNDFEREINETGAPKLDNDLARFRDLNSNPFSFKQAINTSNKDKNIRRFDFKSPNASSFRPGDDTDTNVNRTDISFRWNSAIRQSLMFLAIQHGYAFTQLKTRDALKGNFFKDYAKSVKSLRGWADGGRFFTNYIAHPMQGSFTGFIQIQNDPKGMKQRFGASKDYWNSRLKALAWSAVWSTQFEIGPVSQASIGNVGLNGKQTWIDIVITPTVGTALLISEDAIDRFVMRGIERRTDNFYVIIFSRMLLNPTRTVANLFRFKTPWHRDRPRGI